MGLTSGGLIIDKNVTISGPGANQVSLDGNQRDFVFGVDPDNTVAIAGLSIRNGQVGVGNVGALTVSDCVISGNSSGKRNRDPAPALSASRLGFCSRAYFSFRT